MSVQRPDIPRILRRADSTYLVSWEAMHSPRHIGDGTPPGITGMRTHFESRLFRGDDGETFLEGMNGGDVRVLVAYVDRLEAALFDQFPGAVEIEGLLAAIEREREAS